MNIEELNALSAVIADQERELVELRALEDQLDAHGRKQHLMRSLLLLKITVVLQLGCLLYAGLGYLVYLLGYFRLDAPYLYVLLALGVFLMVVISGHIRSIREFRTEAEHPQAYYELQQLRNRQKVSLNRLEQIRRNLDAETRSGTAE